MFCDSFAINATTGEVSVAQDHVLDFDSGRKVYQLSVSASDGQLQNETTLTVNLMDVNDNAPKFLRSEYRAEIKEGEDQFLTTLQVQVKFDKFV